MPSAGDVAQTSGIVVAVLTVIGGAWKTAAMLLSRRAAAAAKLADRELTWEERRGERAEKAHERLMTDLQVEIIRLGKDNMELRGRVGTLEADKLACMEQLARLGIRISELEATVRRLAGRTRILLAEDDPAAAAMLVRQAQHIYRDGVRIVVAASLDLTLHYLEAEPGSFGAVILDLGLRDSSGLATWERVREAAPETPLVVWTGSALTPDELAVLDGDGTIYIKSGERDQVARVVQAAVTAARAARQEV